MFYIVSYDIVDDGLRQRLHDKLLGYGSRIQDSVFESLLDDELHGRLLAELDRLPLCEQGRIRVYKLCRRCVDEVRIYGIGEVTRDPDFYLI